MKPRSQGSTKVSVHVSPMTSTWRGPKPVLLLLALGHPPVHLLASPRNFRTTQRVLLPLPPSLTCHQLCTGSLAPLQGPSPPTPGRLVLCAQWVCQGLHCLPSLPPALPPRIPNRTHLWSDSAYRPCSHWAGAGASSGEEPGGQGDSWGGCRAVATAMEPVCAHRDSCQRGWRLLYIVAAYHSCSEVLQPHLTHFLQDVSRTPGLPFQGEGQASGDPGPGACLHHTRTGWAASRRA